jgi:hypothetical protein
MVVAVAWAATAAGTEATAAVARWEEVETEAGEALEAATEMVTSVGTPELAPGRAVVAAVGSEAAMVK